MLDVHEGHVTMLHNGRQVVLVLLLEQELHEALYYVHFNVTAVVAGYEHFALRVQNEYGREGHFSRFFDPCYYIYLLCIYVYTKMFIYL